MENNLMDELYDVEKVKFGVILLSAGSGKRMHSDMPKQYLDLNGYPVLYYSLKAFEDNPNISDIVLVVSDEYNDYVQDEIIDRYGFTKVKRIIPGGKERYNSVYNGLIELIELYDETEVEYIMIHDGARPFVTQDMLERLIENVQKYGACIPAVPSKDTICISDENDFIDSTPDRNRVFNVQTPQTFDLIKLKRAFDEYFEGDDEYDPGMFLRRKDTPPAVTDDAMVWRMFRSEPVKIVEGDYNNIKITTPEDMKLARSIING